MQNLLLAVFCSAISLAVNIQIVHAGDCQAEDIVKVLKAKDFWDKDGKTAGREWADAERKQLAELKSSSKDAVVRLRANKVLVDLAGNSRFGARDETVALAGFRYLEGRLKEAPVQELCAEQGFTHYVVSTKNDGSVWFLIEHVESAGFNGGLNLSWDVKKKVITSMQSWGEVPAP